MRNLIKLSIVSALALNLSAAKFHKKDKPGETAK